MCCLKKTPTLEEEEIPISLFSWVEIPSLGVAFIKPSAIQYIDTYRAAIAAKKYMKEGALKILSKKIFCCDLFPIYD